MSDLKHITIWDSCFICGSNWTLYTECPQECECGQKDGCEQCDSEYWAYDGDTVQCPECGALGWVSVDEEASVNYDEESEHNIRCAELYEAREREKEAGHAQ